MRSNYQIAVAVTAGVAIGVIAVQGLHAQAEPPVFRARYRHDQAGCLCKGYVTWKAQAIINELEFAFWLSEDLPQTGTVTAFDGDAPKRVVVQVW